MKKVMIKEMAPRDGLQNEKETIPTEKKVELIQKLGEVGIRYIEASAFVSPKAIPQLADAEEVFKRLKKKKSVTYSALVPNQKGMERALAAGADEVAVFTAASETFNQKNIQASISESFIRFADVFPLAIKNKIKVRGYVSTAFVCPYEGDISPQKAAEVIFKLLDMGCYEVSIGDTIGKATTPQVKSLLDILLKKIKESQFAGHFHDTYHTALQNILTSYEYGITTFDSSAGGIGGCPYAPGASGNVSTADVVQAFQDKGVETGIDLKKLREVSDWIKRDL